MRLGWAPHTHYKIFPQHAGDSPVGVAEVAVKEGGRTGPTEADTNMRRGRMRVEREGGGVKRERSESRGAGIGREVEGERG